MKPRIATSNDKVRALRSDPLSREERGRMPITSISIEATDMGEVSKIRLRMVVNAGTPHDAVFGTEELMRGMFIGGILNEARQALKSEGEPDIAPRCPACKTGREPSRVQLVCLAQRVMEGEEHEKFVRWVGEYLDTRDRKRARDGKKN
jgi:hypothetical protein